MGIRLGTKLLAAQVVALVIALATIGLTLLVAWKLEGGAAAINDAGSLRMRAYRLAYLAEQVHQEGRTGPAAGLLRADLAEYDRVLDTLRRGDPARPLFLPENQGVRDRMAALDAGWQTLSRQLAATVSAPAAPVIPRAQFERFVSTVNDLVVQVEADVASTTALLRGVQLALVLLAVAGAVVLTYLSFLFIVRPVISLKDGIERMAGADFSVRLPLISRDELGMVSAGFNRMADQLQALYGELEARVESKTRSLAEKNARLATLYEMTSFLGAPHGIEDLARGFLRRLIAGTGADAGSVRLTDEEDRKLLLYVHEGLPAQFVAAERCLPAGTCACGDAVSRAASVIELVAGRRLELELPHCRQAGFAAMAAFPIISQGTVIGVYNLFFRSPRDPTLDERHLLETLGQHFGVALQNRRLAEREREMAISEERNLLAQQLHDSIAQSLAFLNLQVQMLRDAIARGDYERAREDLGGVQAGVQETYADVRELLTHFRMRLGESTLEEALASLLQRFSRQTGIDTRIEVTGAGLAPSPDSQLQMLHIVQEALSNVRKHSGSTRVTVAVGKGAVYRIAVRDDGRGFEPDAAHGEDHVGLAIMRERAARIGATLRIRAAPGAGTEVVVEMPLEQRPEVAGVAPGTDPPGAAEAAEPAAHPA